MGATIAMSTGLNLEQALARIGWVPPSLPELAARVPQRWRRRVPTRARNVLVARFGHPSEPFDPYAYPAKLNLGCGYDKRPGYLNIDFQDFHDPDLVGDVRSLPELPTGRYTEIIAQDILEHLERDQTAPTLQEWRRLAAPGARLELRVPDTPSMARWLTREDDVEHQRLVLHHMFGTQVYSGDYHLSGFTDLLLCDELFHARFGRVEMDLLHDWLWVVEAFADAPPVGLVWGPGFYPGEADGRRWADTEAELVVCAGHPIEVALGLELSRHPDADTRLSIEGPHGVETLELAAEPAGHEVRFTAPPGATRFRFRTEGEPAHDGRVLAFRASGRAALA